MTLLYQDRLEYIYAASEQGVCRYDLWEWTALAETQTFDGGEPRTFVESSSALYVVTTTRLWKIRAGTTVRLLYEGSDLHASVQEGEVFLVDGGEGKHLNIRGETLERIDPEVRLPPGRILDYKVDSSRIHWLATTEGLFSRNMGRRAWRSTPDRELEPRLQSSRCVRFFTLRVFGTPDILSAVRGRVPVREELWAYFGSVTDSRAGGVVARLEESDHRWKALAEMEGPRIQGIINDAEKNYYATDEDGLLRFSRDGREWVSVPDLGIEKVALHALLVDKSGTLWFRIGSGGLAAFDPQDRRWEPIPTGGVPSFPNVLSVIETEEGDIWMGMSKGLVRYRRGAEPDLHSVVHGVPLERLTGLGEDTRRRIWVSSGEAFPGAFCFNESIWTQETVPGFSDYPIRRIVRDRVGELWFLSQERTADGRYVIYHCSIYTAYGILPVTVPHGPVNDLTRTREVIDGKDLFWIATDDGLLRGTIHDGEFRLVKRYTEDDGLRSRRVFALAEGPDDAIWVCYPGSSAGVTWVQGPHTRHFDEEDGLASPEVWSIASKGRNLWFGTDRGLTRFDGECWYNYSVASSDPRTSRVLPIFPSIFESDSVLIGTWGQGAFRFRLEDRQRPRRPRFTTMDLPTQVGPEGSVDFSWDARDYRNDTRPEELLFRNRLDRESWTPFGSVRSRRLEGLTPGSHLFEVEVRDLDGNRNREELVHRFVVEKPAGWGAAWVFLLGGCGLIVVLLAFLYGPRLATAGRRWKLYREFLSQYPASLFVIDSNGILLELLGAPVDLGADGRLPARRLRGRPLGELPLFAENEVQAALKRLLSGEHVLVRRRRWTASDGKERVFEIRGFPLGGPRTGSVEGSSGKSLSAQAVVIVDDRTHQFEEDRLLHRTRRLNSLRDFASRLLASIGRFWDEPVVKDCFRSSPELRSRLGEIESLAARLQSFAGREATPEEARRQGAGSGDAGVSALSLNSLIDGLLGEDSAGLPPSRRFRPRGNVRVDFRGQPGLWSVEGDADLLREALFEVLRNASDSMPERGVLTVRVGNVRLESDPGILAPGAYVEVQVQDTGGGIDPGQIEFVFEPFYSTKPRDRALGIGLSIAYGIIRSHGGDLRLDSRPGHGTTVRILLPAIRGA